MLPRHPTQRNPGRLPSSRLRFPPSPSPPPSPSQRPPFPLIRFPSPRGDLFCSPASTLGGDASVARSPVLDARTVSSPAFFLSSSDAPPFLSTAQFFSSPARGLFFSFSPKELWLPLLGRVDPAPRKAAVTRVPTPPPDPLSPAMQPFIRDQSREGARRGRREGRKEGRNVCGTSSRLRSTTPYRQPTAVCANPHPKLPQHHLGPIPPADFHRPLQPCHSRVYTTPKSRCTPRGVSQKNREAPASTRERASATTGPSAPTGRPGRSGAQKATSADAGQRNRAGGRETWRREKGTE